MTNESELNALIQLLDDTDQEVFKHVHAKLMSYGIEVVPKLEQAWSADLPPAAHERLEEIIHEIQFNSLTKEWKLWLSKDSPDLLTGAFLVSKYFYPDADFNDVQRRLQKMRQSIWLELNYNQTPLEQIQIFNQVFYNYYGFKGQQSSATYQDYCINHVLENRTGNAVSVGIVYQILATDLNLPVYGVNLLRHYILSFCKKNIFDFNTETNLEREVMFYINPINRGAIFSRNEIKDYLEKMKEEQKHEYFAPAESKAIIGELIRNLVEMNTEQGETLRADELTYLGKLITE
ncbi:MAG TPA: transglutaminase-like domain-containing protein [Chitinophagales bacterium]|nr:transglutaminase-like domain-containing protein [Chitinophagales bacterium]